MIYTVTLLDSVGIDLGICVITIISILCIANKYITTCLYDIRVSKSIIIRIEIPRTCIDCIVVEIAILSIFDSIIG